MALTVENLCGLLIRSRLHPAAEVKAAYQRWQTEGADKASVKAFTRWLIDKQLLTPYQCTLLTNGYADNFFLGDYKILDRIGKGRMAGVYKAVHPSGQVVAIKVLPPSKALEPQTLARFQREAQLATQLVHHCVVRTFHHGESNGLHFLVMEYLEGDTLEAILNARRKLPPREAVRIAFLTCLGLQHIHEKGMVHRDLKPGNLMICPAPNPQDSTLRSMVKILDIGLGRTLFDPKSKERQGELTGEGTILGTPDYLAPEQARDARTVDIRADLYSLGCTMYHMLSGQPPFPDTNPVQQILRHAREAPKPLQELKAESPEALNQIVAKLMAKDPAQRYAVPAKAADALRAFLGAEADAAKSKAEPRELQSYLEALKKGPEPAPDATVTESAAVQFPLPAKVAARPAKPPPSRAAMATAKKRRRERMTKVGATQPAPVAAPASAAPPTAKVPAARTAAVPAQPLAARPAELPRINVELVPAPTMPAAPFGLPLPRDVFMLLAGALAGAAAVLAIVTIVWILSLLLQGSHAEVPQ